MTKTQSQAESDVVHWHTLRVAQVLAELESNAETGLTREVVATRLAQSGRNELPDKGGRSPWRILWEQFTATMVLVLIAAAIVSALVQKWHEAAAIGAIIVLFGLLGFVQEYRSEQAMAALKKMTVPQVRVRRHGQVQVVQTVELVPGDIVLLEAGNVVPADVRLLEAINLRVQESALTGEATPVDKQVAALEATEVPLGDRRNMGYMNSTVVYGRGVGVVVATGSATELGKLAQLLQGVGEELTPLQQRLNRAGQWLAGIGLVVALGVGLLARMQGATWIDVFLLGISIAVAVVPEGLPAVVTITLALGARRMLARNALVRKLPSVETLGSVTVICSDKTGTLTENRMKATVLDVAEHQVDLRNGDAENTRVSLSVMDPPDHNQEALRLLLMGGALCNDAELNRSGTELVAVGDPTETALVMAAAQFGLLKDELDKALPRVAELPFDSERKRMTTVHAAADLAQVLPVDETHVAFTKGAVDGLLTVVSSVWVHGAIVPLDAGLTERIHAAQNMMAENGMRVLGVAFKPASVSPDAGNMPPDRVEEVGLTYIGCVGIMDPPRSEARDAVAKCQQAGIRTVMITGDHPLTAINIARELGLARNGDRALTGVELDRMDAQEFQAAVQTVNVFARVAPEHKLRIVETLQGLGQTVAMTGDGVNDAPALKQANIGVAMGITGTDVSKEAADMVLRDDNFATIVAAVEEGRVIYDNLRRFLKFSIAGNLGKILVMVVGGVTGLPIPLLPLQLLWLNLLTDGLLGVGLGVEGAERNVMARKPIPASAGIFSGALGGQIVRMGIVIGAIALAVGLWAWQQGWASWQTLAFTTLAFGQVWQAFGLRSNQTPVWQQGMLSNRALLGLAALVIGLQLAAVYVPALQTYLGTVSLRGAELALAAGAGSGVLVWAEVEKAWVRRSSARVAQ